MNTMHDIRRVETETGVIHTLLYFDIFHYPLTVDELVKFHPQQDSREQIQDAITLLLDRGLIFQTDKFYSLHDGTAFSERRKAGNALALKKLITAQRYSRLIAQFPFVRGILLSGSLSKGYMDTKSDIDYFIITSPRRLWLTRGLLALFKRAFLFNSRKYFCTNYLIDSETLEIEEKNFYTAVETTTLIPVYGKQVCEKFILSNTWTTRLLPNMEQHPAAYITEGVSFFKRFSEWIFSGFAGERLDVLFMHLAVKRWRTHFGNLFTQQDFDLAFKSRRNVSKNHPRFFQKHVLTNLREKIEQFEIRTNTKLSA